MIMDLFRTARKLRAHRQELGSCSKRGRVWSARWLVLSWEGSNQNMTQKSAVDSASSRLTLARQHYWDTTTRQSMT